jgi:hypothetical protein
VDNGSKLLESLLFLVTVHIFTLKLSWCHKGMREHVHNYHCFSRQTCFNYFPHTHTCYGARVIRTISPYKEITFELFPVVLVMSLRNDLVLRFVLYCLSTKGRWSKLCL